MKKKLENLVKNNDLLNKIYSLLGSLPFKLLGIFVSEKKNTILFNSFMGKSFNDSPKVIYDQIVNDPYFDNYTFIWAFNDVNKYNIVDSRTKVVKMDSFNYFLTALRSSCWITNVNVERGLHFKKKYTLYINTWHGIPMKKIGNDVAGRNDFDFSDIDMFTYSGEFEKEIYKRAFWLNDSNMFPYGMPRNDLLISNDEDFTNKVKSTYNIKDKKIILYAPTWRDDEKDLPSLHIDKWERVLGAEYVLLIRAHGLMDSLDLDESEFVIDATNYEETSELLTAADILISDYSSILFDYSLTSKPMVVYAPDYKKYSRERGVYFNLLDCGLNVYEDENDVLKFISSVDLVKEENITEVFRDKFFYASEGDSSLKIIDFIKDQMEV